MTFRLALWPFLLSWSCGGSVSPAASPSVAPGAVPERTAGVAEAVPASFGAVPAAPRLALESSAFLVPDQELADRGYIVQVHRSYRDEWEAGLIRAAEAEPAAPPSAPCAAGGAPEDWWFTDFDGVRIACAVTSEALAYYLQVLGELRTGDTERTSGIVMTEASLKYEASVERAERFEFGEQVFEDVFVVRLALGWWQFCGAECAMGFHKERVVVFDAAGTVQAVLFDGETPYLVS